MPAELAALTVPGDAAGFLRLCLEAPNDVAAWLALGHALRRAGDEVQSEQAFAEAAMLTGDPMTAALQRVQAALASGDGQAELERLELATHTHPLDEAAWTARALLLERLGRREDGIDCLEVATSVAPDEPRAAKLLALLLSRCNRPREAERALRRACALDPYDASLKNDLAVVLMRLCRFAEAHAALQQTLNDSDRAQHLSNLASATVVLGLQEEAEAVAREAVSAAPHLPQTWRSLCNVLPYRDGITGPELLQALRACALRLPRGDLPPPAVDRDPDRPLRVGLLSGSLREHPVGWLTIAGFETLDPGAFQLIALAQAESADAIARRFRTICAEWHRVADLADEQLAELARSLRIDVLIELGGHGDNARMAACARRLAPVQIKWVGMQNHSTGLPEMDWFITDRRETPPHLAHLYTERLLIMPDGYVCYSPPTDAPDVGPSPAAARGHVTFGCFNNLAKITPRVIETWSRVLHRTGGARLVLKTQALSDAGVADRIMQAFRRHGVDQERVELRGASPHRAFLAQYNDIDVVLDPFPYSGGLTTCEALWMGAPVLTLPGETFASRHSASHLSNVGLADWIAQDAESYVETAARRAADLPGLASLRSGLRARVRASPLCDAPRFGRHLGAALRRAWRSRCAEAAA